MSRPLAPTGDRVTGADVADWAEALTMLEGKTVKRGDLKSAVDGLRNPEYLLESAWAVLESRAAALGPSWPFQLTESRFKRSPALSHDQRSLYAYFALLAYAPLADADRLMFEKLVHHIVQMRFNGAALRIGHPATGRMPKEFPRRVRLYAGASRLRNGEVGSPPLSADKDLGMDVVAWYSHSDRRGGDLHFLVQCATGRDWTEKTHDINLIELAPHIFWGATPVRIMCIPRSIVVDEPRWLRWSRSAGMILDRSRLFSELTAKDLPVHIQTDLEKRIDALVDA